MKYFLPHNHLQLRFCVVALIAIRSSPPFVFLFYIAVFFFLFYIASKNAVFFFVPARLEAYQPLQLNFRSTLLLGLNASTLTLKVG